MKVNISGKVTEIIDMVVKKNSANGTGYAYFPEKHVGKHIKVLVMEDKKVVK